MPIHHFNLDLLVSVKVSDKVECQYIKYTIFGKGFLNWLLHGKSENGFYYEGTYTCYTKEMLEQGKFNDTKFIVEDRKVYFKPHVLLTFAGGKQCDKEFDTYDEAKAWGQKMSDRGMKNRLTIPS